MRIGIEYRVLSAGINIHRGMGRYTQQQLREVLRIDTQNEYILFCPPHADQSLILPEIRSAPNVSIARVAIPKSPTATNGDPTSAGLENVLRYAEEFQSWVYHQHVDVYHATTPFVLTDDILLHFDACPMIATYYDAIPMMFPHSYLPKNGSATHRYFMAYSLFSEARRLIAISQSARQDAVNYLGFPAGRIDVAYPIADPCFHDLPESVVLSRLERLRASLKLPDHFIMTVTHLHRSKNLETLLAAYSLVSPTLRRQLPLVITCHFTDGEREHVRALAAEHGVADNVIATGYVTEDELVALYNAATIVIHPSLYEGFGLPVLEALCCGTPVITTTASSLPEVGGGAAVLVDPDDVRGFADTIEGLYSDPMRRSAMRQLGHEHAKKFSPTQLAENTLETYRKAAAPPAAFLGSVQPRPRVALWTPLPPQRTGIADYVADLLLEQLSKAYDIEIFVDDGCLPSTSLLTRYAIYNYRAFERRHATEPFDTVIYQLGASPFHLYMYEPLQKTPGIVVLHDLSWSYALYASMQHQPGLKDFKRELLYTEGSGAVREFGSIRPPGGGILWDPVEPFLNRHYMLKRITESSKAVVVHCERFKDELDALYPDTKIRTIHLGMDDPADGSPMLASWTARQQLYLKKTTVVVGVFGIVDRVKHVDKCIKAFRSLCAEYPDARLFIVGEQVDVSYELELRELVQELGVAKHVTFAGYVGKIAYDRYLLACDVVVNLRHPSRKQMSASLIRAIAAGKPVIITDLPEWGFIPSDLCWRLKPDDDEVDNLAADLVRLAWNPDLRLEMSARARAYFEEDCTAGQMVAKYKAVVEEVTRRDEVLSKVSKEGGSRPQRLPGLGVSPNSQGLLDPYLADSTVEGDGRIVEELSYCKVCELEDFSSPELIGIMRDVFRHEIRHFSPEFPNGAEYRKYWEVAMSVRALRDFGALRPDAVVLGVGAGTETTLFYLTNRVRQVFATDLYLDPGSWSTTAPSFMLFEPERAAPYEFERSRLVVQHMDGRVLHYPDNTFDGIFSSSSIEHFGSLEFIANAAYEMGRVLRPGGVLTLSTEYRLSGPPGGVGIDRCLILSKEDLQRYIVDASGLELVGELATAASDQTLATKRDLTTYIEEADAFLAQQGKYPRAGEVTESKYPHLVLVHEGYVFCSVHLTLRKTEDYPAAANEWARPDPAAIEAISRARVAPARPPDPSGEASFDAPVEAAMRIDAQTQAKLYTLLRTLETIRSAGWIARTLRWPNRAGAVARAVIRILRLGRAQGNQFELDRTLVDHALQLDRQLVDANARLDRRLADNDAHLEKGLGDMNDRLDRRLADNDAHLEEGLGDVHAQLGSLHARVREQAERESAAETRLAEVEDVARQATSHVRLLSQQIEICQGNRPSQSESPVSGEELVRLIREIENDLPDLSQCQSVDIVVQGEAVEEALVAGATYFGNRLASKGPTYRAPNDAWYHVDFTNDWNHAGIFESAAARLSTGGFLVMVTHPEHADEETHEGLELVGDRTLEFGPGKTVRVYAWKRL